MLFRSEMVPTPPRRSAVPDTVADPPTTRYATAKPLEFAADEVLRLAPVSLARSIPVTGTLNASQQTIVKSRVSGDIREINVREGMTVTAGQLVATIDPTEFELRVSEREAALRSAEAQLEQARGRSPTTRRC